MTISLVQAPPPASDDEALQRGLAAVDEAADRGADLVVFPEMWNIGYVMEGPWLERALDPEGPWVKAFADRARQRGVAVAITFLERRTGFAPSNSVRLFDRHGAMVLHYRKVHTCAFDTEGLLTPGEGFSVGDLDTAAGVVKVGAMICFDREFPESARQLSLAGAEVILVPNACELERHRHGQVRARAFENSVVVAVANYTGPGYLGGSSVVSPIVFSPRGESLEVDLVRGGPEPALVTADVNLAEVRAWRRDEVWNGRWRRPERYVRG